MAFKSEAEFEKAVIKELTKKGWEDKIIKYPIEEDLIQNWADILFENNKDIDRLNNIPLTNTEMKQILTQIEELKTPLKLNRFINSKTISIKRDNKEDKLHYGKEISLKIYDRQEIAAGQSRYQIVSQPKFKTNNKILPSRRGDIMLLINGMPVIHIELKKSGIDISQAYNQIEKYSREGVFSGIFSLVQIFVAMNPEESVYFANPGIDGKFNKQFYFHWADFNNEPINEWKKVIDTLLSIPMAHQLIGFYTIADESDGILKVMRSYQYFAASAISDKVLNNNWKTQNKGGYIWHTTGSGKTMTSFKSAQLIASSKNAHKVIFLMDRIELGVQSLREYRGFAGENENVQDTENTNELISKLKSDDYKDTLIVTSIQKMSRIKEDGLKLHDLEKINSKRIVFIIDEAHRSTFGDMLQTIKDTFPTALLFGFTGTPIQEDNSKKKNTTTTIFGDELHRYSIADGIRDGNVLGFDPYKILTYKDKEVREAVALYKAKAKNRDEAQANPEKKKIYDKYMDKTKIKMAGYKDEKGNYIKGIEDFIPKSQYTRKEHKEKVIEDILENFSMLSNNKFHAIFATSSINEAIEYYRLFKEKEHNLKITALFDPNIDNNDGSKIKEDGLIEIFEYYNKTYEQDFTLSNFLKFKKDIAARLAHKEPYIGIEKTPQKQIDILIVVDQMLTGFDSKWINTLYLDKVLKYENIIQAFSRTNRLFGPDKPFGIIRYYRYPHTMEQYINEAVKLYSGDKPLALFVDKLPDNLKKLNTIFNDIDEVFKGAKIENFSKLPDNIDERAKFAKLFKEFNEYLEAAKLQGFKWDKLEYKFDKDIIKLDFDENVYLTLLQRYKELSNGGGEGGSGSDEVPFEIDGYLTEIDTGVIDTNYMNTKFQKYLKNLEQGVSQEELQKTLDELYKSFAFLSQEEQKFAELFIHDVQRGDVKLEPNKTFREYITEYMANSKNTQIDKICNLFNINKEKLVNMLNSNVTEENINEFGRFDELKKDIDWTKAKEYFETKENKKLSPPKVKIKLHNLLKDFVIKGGFDL